MGTLAVREFRIRLRLLPDGRKLPANSTAGIQGREGGDQERKHERKLNECPMFKVQALLGKSFLGWIGKSIQALQALWGNSACMTKEQFARQMTKIRWPYFGGIGVNTSAKTTTYPPYSGRWFLGATLEGKKVNGKIRFTNEAY